MNNGKESLEIDYSKDYSTEELLNMPLWDFYRLCIYDGSGRGLGCTSGTVRNLLKLLFPKDRDRDVKIYLAWCAGHKGFNKELQDIWNKDYCEMIEKLPDAIVKDILKGFMK